MTDTYVWDKNREISQIITKKSRSADTTNVFTYVYGDKLINQEVKGQISYYLNDGQLSTRKLIDDNVNVTDTYDYDAFGDLTSSIGSTDNEFLYTGQQYDFDTGLYYLRARYMNPKNGRFISRDLYDGNIFEPKTLHKYAYVSNNPVSNYDPQGLWMQKVIQGILAHRFINIKYIVEHPNNIVNRDRIFGGIVGLGGLIRNYVDIIDYTTGEIYEIKPYNGVIDGAAQVAGYLELITTFVQRGKYFSGQQWRLGSSWPVVPRVCAWPLGGAIMFWLEQEGLLFYKVVREDGEAYDNAYAWSMLKMPKFDVGYVDEFAGVMFLAASIPGLIRLAIQARSVSMTMSFIF